MVRSFLSLFFLLCLAACAGRSPGIPERHLHDARIGTDALWQGRVFIDGTVRIVEGANLTILPGTEINFLPQDRDGNGLGDGALVVDGTLRAEGTQAQPIRFRSGAGSAKPGDWLEIRVEGRGEIHLRWCEVSDAVTGLHLVAARGTLEDCILRGNIDGSRLEHGSFSIRNCLIEKSTGQGLALRNSRGEVARNIIRDNGTGVFLRESDRGLSLRENNLYGNGDNLRLGDAGMVALAGNWWGSADAREAAATVHDRRRNPDLGVVTLAPAPAWVEGSGPREHVELREVWRFAAGGFIDGGAVAAAAAVYVPSWDGALYALDRDGKLLWKKVLGDVLDAVPALDDHNVYLQSWQREVRALDRRDGREIWRFTYSPSSADDYRQGGVLHAGDLLLVPGWNGYLYALDPVTGNCRWQADAGLPLRAAPVVDGERIYQASGTGKLSAWNRFGDSLWQVYLGAPLLASPAVTPAGPVAVASDGLLVAYDRQGRERWRRRLGEPCDYAAPLYHDGALYVGTAAGHLWKLEAASGSVLWRFQATGPLSGRPLLADGRLFIGDNSGRLQTVGADSGELLGSFRTEGEIQGSPVRLGNRIVIGSRDHRVYGLELLEGERTVQKN